MLVLARKKSERILIGDNISVMIVRVQNGNVYVGVEAPDDVAVDREEVRISKLEADPQ